MVASKAAGQEDRDRSVSVTVTDREYEAAVIESLKDRADKSSDVDKEVILSKPLSVLSCPLLSFLSLSFHLFSSLSPSFLLSSCVMPRWISYPLERRKRKKRGL